MTDYTYEDREGDRLRIQPVETGPNEGTYIVTNNGIGVYVPADEAPKAAQALLDAAGVKGVVIVGSNINVTLGAKAEQAWEKRHQAEVKAAEEAAAKKAHDDLRTSPIALKALALYNRGLIGRAPYASWDAANEGNGASDFTVNYYIGQVEAKEKEAAEKLAARRDALAVEHFEGVYAYLPREGYRKAIDRIIELENKVSA